LAPGEAGARRWQSTTGRRTGEQGSDEPSIASFSGGLCYALAVDDPDLPLKRERLRCLKDDDSTDPFPLSNYPDPPLTQPPSNPHLVGGPCPLALLRLLASTDCGSPGAGSWVCIPRAGSALAQGRGISGPLNLACARSQHVRAARGRAWSEGSSDGSGGVGWGEGLVCKLGSLLVRTGRRGSCRRFRS
jgi:hypothetical protein